MLYKVWPEICKIQDIHFRLAVALSDNQLFFNAVEKGFPHLFTGIKPEREGPFPLSYLKEVADQWCGEGNGDETTLHEAFRLVGMPDCLCAHPGADVYSVSSITMPPELSAAARYKELADTYGSTGEKNFFPYSLQEVEINGERFYVGWVNEDGVMSNHDKDMDVYPAALVDVNS